jgi:Tol biopolymer transport system component
MKNKRTMISGSRLFIPVLLLYYLCSSVFICGYSPAEEKPAPARLLIAFASVRERRAPPYPVIYFYEHDGVAGGKLLGPVESADGGINKTRSDMRPTLSGDGRFCAFSAQFGVTDGGRIAVWDRQEKKFVPQSPIVESPDAHRMSPSFSADGRRVVFSAWAQPGGSPRWGVYLYDLPSKKLIDLPKLNGETVDQRLPALSADGRILAYASNAKGGVGLTDVYLYDVQEKKVLAVPEMNSPSTDMQPSLSGDGRRVALVSNRPGGKGGRDIYLYARTAKQFLPLPGLNTAADEHSPSLSADGRYIAFVSERLGGVGERDVYLYDRESKKLLPTPGLNSRDDDYDPCVLVLKPQK